MQERGCPVPGDDGLAARRRLLRNVGRETLGPSDVVELGFNFRMSELNAALGVVQLRRLERILEARRRIAEYYDREISRRLSGLVRPQRITPGGESSYYAYIVYLEDPTVDRDRLRARLLEECGVETTIIYRPVHLMPLYRRLYPGVRLPVTEDVGARNLALPIYAHMTLEQAKYVVECLEAKASEESRR